MLASICRNKQKPENYLTEMNCCFGLQPRKGMAFLGLYVPGCGQLTFLQLGYKIIPRKSY